MDFNGRALGLMFDLDPAKTDVLDTLKKDLLLLINEESNLDLKILYKQTFLKHFDLAKRHHLHKRKVEKILVNNRNSDVIFEKTLNYLNKHRMELFEITRNVSGLSTGMYPDDDQLKAAIGLNDNLIVEAGTGFGKTLTIVMDLYFQSFLPEGTHVVTSNIVLARDGAKDNRKILNALGLNVCVTENYNVDQLFKDFVSDLKKI